MATTYNTGNAIGSADPRDAYDNASNFDEFANSTDTTFSDRFGASHPTMRGIETSAESRITNALANWTQPVARGAWNTATAYNTGELWDTGGTLYLVVEDYTSGASAAADIAAGYAVEYTNINRQRVYVSLADMQNATPLYDGETVSVSGDADWTYRTGDYSGELANDPENRQYLATAANPSGNLGAWEKYLPAGVVNEYLPDAISRANNRFSLAKHSAGIIHLCAGIDSLTDGAGSNGGLYGDTYFNFVSAALRKQYGDAGAGWTSFDNRTAAREGMSFYRSANMSYITGLDKTTAPAIYSLDFGGLHSASAIVGDTGVIGWNGSVYDRDWDTATIYYLRQPGGASVSFYQNGSGYVDNIISTDGTLSLMSVTINKSKILNNEVKFRVTTAGACTVFGVMWRRNVTSGVICSRIAYGGYRTEWFAGLNGTFQTVWLAALNPTHYIFNGGRNDVINSTPSEFISYVTTYLGRFPATTKMLLAAPNEASTDVSSSVDMFEFKRLLKSYADANDCTFIDNALTLGRYTQAAADGYMLDTVHPNEKGNVAISGAVLKAMGVSAGYAGFENYTIPRVRYKYVGDAGFIGLAPGATSTLMTLSATQATSCVMTVRISLKSSLGTAMRMERRTFRVLTTANAVATVGTPQLAIEHDDTVTSGVITFTAAISSGNLVLSITSDAVNTGTLSAGVTVEYNIVGNDGSLGDAFIIV